MKELIEKLTEQGVVFNTSKTDLSYLIGEMPEDLAKLMVEAIGSSLQDEQIIVRHMSIYMQNKKYVVSSQRLKRPYTLNNINEVIDVIKRH